MALEEKHYCTTERAAEILGVSTSWLEKLRVRGDGPPYYKVSPRRVLYGIGDLTAWMDEHRTRSTSETLNIKPKETRHGHEQA
jgi:hypothetical protein